MADQDGHQPLLQPMRLKMSDQDGHLRHMQPKGFNGTGQDGCQPHSICSQWDSGCQAKMAAYFTCSQ